MHCAMVFVSFEVLKAIRSPSRRFGREVAGFKDFEENMNAFEPVVTKAVATVFLVAQNKGPSCSNSFQPLACLSCLALDGACNPSKSQRDVRPIKVGVEHQAKRPVLSQQLQRWLVHDGGFTPQLLWSHLRRSRSFSLKWGIVNLTPPPMLVQQQRQSCITR